MTLPLTTEPSAVATGSSHAGISLYLATSGRYRTRFYSLVGVANVQSKTDVSVDDRTVVLRNPNITETHFHSLDATAAGNIDQLVKTFLPPESSIVTSLGLVASMNKSKEVPTVEVRNDEQKPVTVTANYAMLPGHEVYMGQTVVNYLLSKWCWR